jgi:membrane protein DedA with SNARE-associated domain
VCFLFFTSISISHAQITDSLQLQPNTSSQSILNEKSLVTKVVDWYMYHLNYFSISVLMTIESSFIPFPSEVVIPPAAYAACNPENQSLYVTDYKLLNVFLVVLFGTLGALIGAFINYFLALYLGRPIIYKFADSKLGHLLLLDSSKIKKAEDYFVKHGLAKMKLTPFITYTCLGAGIWNSMLAVLGYIAHGEQDIINKYSHELSYVLLGLGVILLVYLIIKGLKKKNKKKID